MSSDSKMVSLLLKTENYRDFLKAAFVQMKASKKSVSFATLAKKIGCQSKSYPREVMTGRRALTTDYAPRFADAFGIKGDAKKLFLKLVEAERAHDTEKLHSEIRKLKTRMQNRMDHEAVKPQNLFLNTKWIDVFAALGTVERGASINEVCVRTYFKKAQVLEILDAMILKGLVKKAPDSDRYLPIMLHHFFNSSEADSIFQDRLLEILERIKSKTKVSMKSENELFLCSTISVHSSDLPRLKTELRDVINRFVQDSEYAEGDRLSSILVAML